MKSSIPNPSRSVPAPFGGPRLKGAPAAALALSLFVSAPLWAADAVTVGDPKNPAALPQAILDAHDQGAHAITIAPGTYDLPAGQKPMILLENWTNTVIHATGATLIFEELRKRPLLLTHCQGVTWDGGTLRLAQPSFTQGRVTAVGSDPLGGYCDWKVDDGYSSTIVLAREAFDVVDQTTRRIKAGTGDVGTNRAEHTGPGQFRLHFPPGRTPHVAVNDWLVTRAGTGMGVIQLDGCGGCTIKNTILENSGFAAFFETGGAGGNHYLHCTIEPGPRPAGATEDQLVGCGADGFHSANTSTGPDIEDGVFSGVFLDDCIAIHGSFVRVTGLDGSTLKLEGQAGDFKVGDPLRVSDTSGSFAQASITSIQPVGGRAWLVSVNPPLTLTIEPRNSRIKEKGTMASDPAHCGAGYKILRCRLGDTRSRGILVKADNGLIDGCTIEGSGMSAVSIGPEAWWGEAGYCWNVTVTNNQFTGCNGNNGEQATVWIHGDGAVGNRNIAIRGNHFSSCYGETLLNADWVDGVDISGNHFDHSFPLPLKQPGSVIGLLQARHVKLMGNVVTRQDPAAGPLVRLDAGETASDVQNDDATGIQVTPGG